MVDLTLIFLSVMFFYFALVFWQYSTIPVRPFIIRQLDAPQEDTQGDHDSLLDEISADINGYLTSLFRTNKIRFRAAAAGFLIAGIASVAALFIL